MSNQFKINQTVIYQSKAGSLELKADIGDETIWRTQDQVAELFDVQKAAVSKHVSNIFETGELKRQATGEHQMKKERNIAQEILTGIQEIKEWRQGKKKLKVTQVDMPEARDVEKIRKKLKLDQEDFADLMGVSVKTLQNWEQKRREPQGAAKSLLRVGEKDPGAVLKALPRSSSHARKHKPTKIIKKSCR